MNETTTETNGPSAKHENVVISKWSYRAAAAGFLIIAMMMGYLIYSNDQQKDTIASLQQTVESQGKALDRRAPTLDYMRCHDRRSDETDFYKVLVLDRLVSVIIQEEGAALEDATLESLRKEWRKNAQSLRESNDESNPNQCPELPDN